MATAVLENNNKFAYLGLRRKPTYDELIGLINENSSLFGPAPDRRATAFKASPEGSFFDGLNYTDRLKEEQERILNKEMRDILFRQNVGNQTISVARLENNQGQSTPSSNSSSLPQQVSLNEGLIQEQLQQRAQQAIQRNQQTGEAHQNMLSQMGRLPILSRLANLTPTSRQTARTQMRTAQQLATSTDDEPELMTDAEMQTARGEIQTARGEIPPEDAGRKITYSTNIASMRAEELKFQLFLRGVDVENQLPNRIKGKGGGKTQKQFYQDEAYKLIMSGRWETRIEEQLLKKRIEEYRSKGARGSKD